MNCFFWSEGRPTKTIQQRLATQSSLPPNELQICLSFWTVTPRT